MHTGGAVEALSYRCHHHRCASFLCWVQRMWHGRLWCVPLGTRTLLRRPAHGPWPLPSLIRCVRSGASRLPGGCLTRLGAAGSGQQPLSPAPRCRASSAALAGAPPPLPASCTARRSANARQERAVWLKSHRWGKPNRFLFGVLVSRLLLLVASTSCPNRTNKRILQSSGPWQ